MESKHLPQAHKLGAELYKEHQRKLDFALFSSVITEFFFFRVSRPVSVYSFQAALKLRIFVLLISVASCSFMR